MLNSYENYSNPDGTKVYPLSDWNNKEVIQYIKKHRLIEPIKYGNTGNTRSQGADVNDISYLLWIKKNYPNDLAKTIQEWPDVERRLFEYYHAQKQTV